MNLIQIIAAEEEGTRAIRTVRPYIEGAARRDAAERASLILAEARHFAVTWDDIRRQEDNKNLNADEATALRQQAIRRLSTFVAPDR